jgi:hypothetical protein
VFARRCVWGWGWGNVKKRANTVRPYIGGLTLPLTLTENEGFSPELVYLGEANLSMKGRVYAPFRLKKNLILKILKTLIFYNIITINY